MIAESQQEVVIPVMARSEQRSRLFHQIPQVRDFVRSALRSTRTPERIEIRDDLPFNETGKLLRRVLREELAERFG